MARHHPLGIDIDGYPTLKAWRAYGPDRSGHGGPPASLQVGRGSPPTPLRNSQGGATLLSRNSKGGLTTLLEIDMESHTFDTKIKNNAKTIGK